MHTDFESIVSARLRNPMLISQEQPGIVDFRAPKFNTTGHWWEVAISPDSEVVGAEFTALPDASLSESFAGNQGPGHSPPEDSLNFIIIGKNDVPCTTGWEVRTGIVRALGGTRQEYLGPILPTSPEEKNKLYRWRLEFSPDQVKLFADLNEDNVLELLQTFNVQVPWQEVYVHLVAVAYEADHHPQNGTCNAWQGQMREFPWKEVSIGPVKYGRVAAFPKEQGLDRAPQQTGWTEYDIRDTQRTGFIYGLLDSVGNLLGILGQLIGMNGGFPQPNVAPYDKFFSLAFCSDSSIYGCDSSTSTRSLSLNLEQQDLPGIVHAQLVYDTRGDGTANLTVNGAPVGLMPGARTVPGASPEQWVRRSLEVPAALLRQGENTIALSMQGNVQMDRLQLEFGYGR